MRKIEEAARLEEIYQGHFETGGAPRDLETLESLLQEEAEFEARMTIRAKGRVRAAKKALVFVRGLLKRERQLQEEAPTLELHESRQLAIAYAFGCIVFQLEEFRILPCSSDPATCSACDYNSRSLILNMREYLHAALDGRIPDEVP